jgi:hypothetical protein
MARVVFEHLRFFFFFYFTVAKVGGCSCLSRLFFGRVGEGVGGERGPATATNAAR